MKQKKRVPGLGFRVVGFHGVLQSKSCMQACVASLGGILEYQGVLGFTV